MQGQARTLRAFRRNDRGNVAMTFGLMAIPLFGIAGAAIDYSRAYSLQSTLQDVLDGAMIAALQEYRMVGDAEEAEAKLAVFLNEGLASRGIGGIGTDGGPALTGGSVDASNSSISPQLTAEMPTIVLGIIGVNSLPVSVSASAALAAPSAQGGKSLELSIALDVSGSMAGTKVEEMKEAAQDFLDIVMPDDINVENRRVGLVPFAGKVNAGSFAAAATGLPSTRQVQSGTTTVYTFSTTSFSWRSLSQCSTRVREITEFASYSQAQAEAYCASNFTTRVKNNATQYNTPSKVSSQVPNYVTKRLKTCVTERQGSEAYTDAAPDTDQYVGWSSPTSSLDSQYSDDGICYSNSVELPAIKALTTEKEELKSHISSLSTYSGTAGHLATAWAWYMLSPLWNSVWPQDSQVVEYSDAETVKAAVIMTDGAYNSGYADASEDAQALALCQAMKDKGVIVYTIGFDMESEPQSSRDLLEQCASPGKYYAPYDGDALREAFQEIGDSLVTIVTTSKEAGVLITK